MPSGRVSSRENLLQALAFGGVLDLPADAALVRIGQEDEVASGKREVVVTRAPWFRWGPGDLDDDFAADGIKLRDILWVILGLSFRFRLRSSCSTSSTLESKLFDDVPVVEEGVLSADVHKGRLGGRPPGFGPALVDASHKALGVGALDREIVESGFFRTATRVSRGSALMMTSMFRFSLGLDELANLLTTSFTAARVSPSDCRRGVRVPERRESRGGLGLSFGIGNGHRRAWRGSWSRPDTGASPADSWASSGRPAARFSARDGFRLVTAAVEEGVVPGLFPDGTGARWRRRGWPLGR